MSAGDLPRQAVGAPGDTADLEKSSAAQKAQTLIVVIAILAVLFIIGAAFFIFSQAERVASVRHLDSLRSRYLAEAGIVYGEQVLKADKEINTVVTLEDKTFTYFAGTDVDLDGDSAAESRWIEVKDLQGKAFGRFALKISDEAGKININSCSEDVLARLFSRLGADSAKAEELILLRPLNAVEEAGSLLSKKDFKQLKDFMTIYSRDTDVDLKGLRRVYLNTCSANLILETFLKRGVKGAHQKAANFKDALDADCAQTIFDKFCSERLGPTSLSEPGSWQRRPWGFYEAPAGGAAGRFTWSNLAVEDGEYYVYLYSSFPEDTVGEAYPEQEEDAEEVRSAEGLLKKVKVSGGSFSLYLRPPKQSSGRFSYAELVSDTEKNGLTRKIIRGSEALVINEIMVRPQKELLLSAAVSIEPAGTYNFTFENCRSGDFYVAVLAENQGGYVGDVTVNSQLSKSGLKDKDYLDGTLTVSSNGEINIQIKNNSLNTSTFRGLIISQQPDAEFIEILNLSGGEIDLGNFSLEAYSPSGELINGWPASVPEGTKISPYGYMVFAFDNDDSSSSAPKQIAGNKISFRKIWGFDAVALVFDDRDIIDENYDLLPDGGAQLVLRDTSGAAVDFIEYNGNQVSSFISLERPDPTLATGQDNDGIFDNWYPCNDKKEATPGKVNENWGMYIEKVKHTPAEITVYNRPFANLSEALQLSSGEKWKKFDTLDIARLSDRISGEAVVYDLKGHYLIGDFNQDANGVFVSSGKDESGSWKFTGVPQGDYLLSIIAKDSSYSGEKIRVEIEVEPEKQGSSGELIFQHGFALYGKVEFSEETSELQVKIVNLSGKEIALEKICLEPVYRKPGRVNANTASLDALASLFGNDGLAQGVISHRPIGIKDNRHLGIGELILAGVDVSAFLDDLTLRSDTYGVLSRGEYSPEGEARARQTVYSVIDRGD